jgi:4-hydroxythreonine-4-phosphate dehydrogenase
VSNCVAITIGDVTGIGPEVTLKAVAAELADPGWNYLLIGDSRYLEQANTQFALGLSFGTFTGFPLKNRISVVSSLPALSTGLPQGSPEAAHAVMSWLREGAQYCLKRETCALVTAPVNKEAIIRAGHRFVGQTEYLAELAGTEQPVMMLLGADDRGRWLRVALATTHLPLREVADGLKRAKIERAIERAALACRDLRLSRARVGVCGLNPHAGEGGKLGTEEQTIIAPAVNACRQNGMDVSGPWPADTLFHYAFRGDYDAVVAMYHDQGLAPLKMIAFESGINWTLGLPFVRTSPDHGTAYDIAGKGTANPSSMIAALRLAKQLSAGNLSRSAVDFGRNEL